MENIISALLVLCLTSFIYGISKIKKLMASGEVTSFNIMSTQNLSTESRTIKKQAIIGFAIFIFSIFVMLIITSINGPVKG